MPHIWIILAALIALLASGCSDAISGDDVTPPAVDDSFVPISFYTDVSTRANTILNDTEALKNSVGIGVFAYFTDEKQWKDFTDGKQSGENTTDEYPIPDYMYNQRVYWGIQSAPEGADPVRGWVYSPVKYWPNSSGNSTPRYISFFAYAPWEEDPDISGATYGIVGMPDSNDKTPHLRYKVGAAGSMTDLLYATPAIDATRNGNGLIEVSDGENNGERKYVYQNVPLVFHHALACVEVYIHRIYDEPIFSGKVPENEKETKLFVSKLEFESNPIVHDEGILNLETGQWENTKGETSRLIYAETALNDSLSGTTSTDLNVITNTELYKWGYDNYGVDEKERCLFAENDGLFFIPQTLTITPTLTYTMVTRDNELALSDYVDISGNKYARIVNEVRGNELKLKIEQGKKYRLIIHIGVEHISFEVASVTDWDFPMRFNPTVDGFVNEEEDKTLNESDE